MKLSDLASIEGFASLKEIDVIKLVMWWAHTHGEEEWISGELLRSFYREMRRALPSGGFTAYFNSLLDRRPPHIIKGREGGYQLEHRML